jgi:hypothetical protein
MTHIMNFSEYTSPAGAITESLTQRSAMIRFNKAFRMFRDSLVKGDKDMFVSSMEALSKFLEDLYGEVRNERECKWSIKTFFWTREYEFNSKGNIIKQPGTTLNSFSASPICNFNYYTTNGWTVYDDKNHKVPSITFRFEWCGLEKTSSTYMLSGHTVSVTGYIDCYKQQKCHQEDFFKDVESQFIKLIKTETEQAKAAGAFGEETLKRYNMVGVTDYVGWVAKNAVAILKSNGLYDTSNFYSGISLNDVECYFWTGGLKGLNADGITYYVGGDSTDEEGIIPYSDWRSVSRYRKYCPHAEVYCDIDYDKKQEFSKKIYDYILNLLKEGKLK